MPVGNFTWTRPHIPGAVGQRLPVPSSHTHLPITKLSFKDFTPPTKSLIAAKCEKKCAKKIQQEKWHRTHTSFFIGMVSACPLGAKTARSHRRRAPTHISPESRSKIREWPGQRSEFLNRDEVGKIDWVIILKWTNYYKASIIITSASRGIFGNAAPLRGRSLRKLSRTRRLAQLGKCDKSGMVQNWCNRKVAELLAIMNDSD